MMRTGNQSLVSAPVQIATARRDDHESDLTTRLAYLAVGGALGALVALLLAPKSGRELRDDLTDVARKGASQLGDKASEYYDSARGVAGRRGDQIHAALEAGKQAYLREKERAQIEDEINYASGYYEVEKRR